MRYRKTSEVQQSRIPAATRSWRTMIAAMVLSLLASFLQAQPATTASLWGVVRYTGPRPTPALIEMRGDKFCVERQRQRALLREDIVVGSQGELANAIVFVDEGPITRGRAAADSPPVDLRMRDCNFVPRVVAVRAGHPLRIWNDDRTLHTVYARPKKNARLLRPLHGPEDSPITVSFSEPELPVSLRCDVQPWMVAHVGIFDHPYFAVTREDGSFELANLPEGDYTIAVWHEKLGQLKESIGLRGGERRSLQFTFGLVK